MCLCQKQYPMPSAIERAFASWTYGLCAKNGRVVISTECVLLNRSLAYPPARPSMSRWTLGHLVWIRFHYTISQKHDRLILFPQFSDLSYYLLVLVRWLHSNWSTLREINFDCNVRDENIFLFTIIPSWVFIFHLNSMQSHITSYIFNHCFYQHINKWLKAIGYKYDAALEIKITFL